MSGLIQYSFQTGFPSDDQELLRQTIHLLRTLRHISFHEKHNHKISSGDDVANCAPRQGNAAPTGSGPSVHSAHNVEFSVSSNLEDSFRDLCNALAAFGKEREEEALRHVLELALSDKELGGLGIRTSNSSDAWSLSFKEREDVVFLVEAWLEALNSADSSRRLPDPVATRGPSQRPMTLSEKIFAHHATRVSSAAGVKPGDFIRVSVDWVIASELSWVVSTATFYATLL